MRGGTLKREALVFEGKDFRSRGDYGGVFEMNQDPVSSEQNNCGEHERQKARKCMRHSFPDRGGHMGEGGVQFDSALPITFDFALACNCRVFRIPPVCRALTPQSNFISLS